MEAQLAPEATKDIFLPCEQQIFHFPVSRLISMSGKSETVNANQIFKVLCPKQLLRILCLHIIIIYGAVE